MSTAGATLSARANHFGSASRWLPLATLLVLGAFLYADVVRGLFSQWLAGGEDDTTYGMLVPPFAAYMAWLRRDLFFKAAYRPTAHGLWGIAFACLMFLVGRLGGEFFITRLSLVVLVAGIVWTFEGFARLKALTFPLILLATMVPLPQFFYMHASAKLQLLASTISAHVAQSFGVTVHRNGNVLELANMSLGVAQACSGLRSLPAFVIGGLLLALVICRRHVSRTLLVLISVPLAVFFNVLRVSGTAVLAEYWPDTAMGFYHSFSGWAVFVVGLTALYGVAKVTHRYLD